MAPIIKHLLKNFYMNLIKKYNKTPIEKLLYEPYKKI